MAKMFVNHVIWAIYLMKKTVYKIYKNCLNLDFLSKVKENLHLQMCMLFEEKDHFLYKIINEKFYYHQKCMFTGTNIYVDVSVTYSEWEKIKIDAIVKKEKSSCFQFF